MGNFLNTALGSYFKVFAAAILLTVMHNGGITGLNWTDVLNGAIVATIPVIINALNPADRRYGKKQ